LYGSKKRQFIVEMQMLWTDSFMNRVLFNASKAYVKQLKTVQGSIRVMPVCLAMGEAAGTAAAMAAATNTLPKKINTQALRMGLKSTAPIFRTKRRHGPPKYLRRGHLASSSMEGLRGKIPIELTSPQNLIKIDSAEPARYRQVSCLARRSQTDILIPSQL
jgi:hypothetical protein